MRIQELKEGLLDDISSALKNSDGVVGFLKNMAGGNAKLDQLAEKIRAEAESILLAGQTNLRQPGVKDEDIPMNRLIAAAFGAAAEFSKTGQFPVSRQQLFSHFRANREEILDGINAQAKGVGLARAAADEVVKLLSNQTPEPIPGAGLAGNLQAVSLIAAVTLMDFEYRQVTDVGGGPTSEFKLSDEDTQNFNSVGDRISATLFTPGSELHRALRANAGFKENLESLVVDLVQDVQSKLVRMPTERLKAMAGKPTNIVSANKLRGAFLGHLDPSDPVAASPEVNNFVNQQKENFENFLAAWIDMAIKEREGGQEASNDAFFYMHDWAKDALRLVDSIRPVPAKQQKQQRPTAAGGATEPTQATQATAQTAPQTQATPQAAAGAGQYSEPMGFGGEQYVKGPNGWVDARTRRTPAPDNVIKALDAALEKDQRLKAAGVQPR